MAGGPGPQHQERIGCYRLLGPTASRGMAEIHLGSFQRPPDVQPRRRAAAAV